MSLWRAYRICSVIMPLKILLDGEVGNEWRWGMEQWWGRDVASASWCLDSWGISQLKDKGWSWLQASVQVLIYNEKLQSLHVIWQDSLIERCSSAAASRSIVPWCIGSLWKCHLNKRWMTLENNSDPFLISWFDQNEPYTWKLRGEVITALCRIQKTSSRQDSTQTSYFSV